MAPSVLVHTRSPAGNKPTAQDPQGGQCTVSGSEIVDVKRVVVVDNNNLCIITELLSSIILRWE